MIKEEVIVGDTPSIPTGDGLSSTVFMSLTLTTDTEFYYTLAAISRIAE